MKEMNHRGLKSAVSRTKNSRVAKHSPAPQEFTKTCLHESAHFLIYQEFRIII